ncbi:hypothetical protein AALP_AA8G169700 [Arabis alpina]|uniref:Ubiquitin receptor RAD23 n=1 Tax=Arabis alpina TaxID=50452 RepID=A0A087G7J4_ARAAL|nr:hypothetical protein AALP_AA8G169700 [Arabis alpina]
MKIVVKTLKGDRFKIQVKPDDSVADVKKNIETVLGPSEYPAAEQTLIHKGRVLKDETTMQANGIAEKSSVAIMKRKPASSGRKAAEKKGFYYFPEGLPNDGSLEFLRHTQQFRVLRSLVPSNLGLLQGILEAIEKENPPLFKMIRENGVGFLSLLKDEPVEGGVGGNQTAQTKEQLLRYLLASLNNDEGGESDNQTEEQYPKDEYVQVTPEEIKSLQRLEAMGFESGLVLEVADVKKNIETVLGASEFPAAEQTLIHKGKVLKDETTMEANNVAEKSSVAIMKGIQKKTQEPAAAETKGFYYFPEGLPNDGSLEFFLHTQQNEDGFLSLLKYNPVEGGAGGNQTAQPQKQLLDDLLASLNNDEGGDSDNQTEEQYQEDEYVLITHEENESLQRVCWKQWDSRAVWCWKCS